jgi:hypothetical protein
VEQASDPLHRAASWYVAAFGAIVAVLIAGVGVASFDWKTAANPKLAALLASGAVLMATAVVIVAGRVLTPRWTDEALRRRQDSASKGLGAADWQETAAADRKVLAPLYTEDGFSGDRDSPMSLTAQTKTGSPSDRQTASKRLKEMVIAANARSSRRWYGVLTWTAPFALAVVLICALSWTSISKPQLDQATSKNPIAVTLRLAPNVNPTAFFGSGCSARERPGVAIDGDIRSSALIALVATETCKASLLTFTPTIGTVVHS